AQGGEGRSRAARGPARKAGEEGDGEQARGRKRDTSAQRGTREGSTARENGGGGGPAGHREDAAGGRPGETRVSA
ncbi:hypothetical protein C3R30_21470, partial [Mycobacterium tuberculosis]